MTETATQPIDIMLVLPGDELWGAEQLRAELAAAGLRLIAEEEFRGNEPGVHRKPAAILAFLTGRLETDAAVCGKLVNFKLAPVIAISMQNDEDYVLALFAAGVEDVVQRPIKSRELAARIRSILRRVQPQLRLQSLQGSLAVSAANLPAKKGFESFLVGLKKRFTPGKS